MRSSPPPRHTHHNPTIRRPSHRSTTTTTLLLLLLLLTTVLPTCRSFTTLHYPHLQSPPSPTTHLTMTTPTTTDDIDTTLDPRLYRIRIPRAPGIEWGTDLSFSFVYVRSLEPSGPAALSGLVAVGDQICELRPVVYDEEGEGVTGGGDAEDGSTVGLIGSAFDVVMGAFAGLERSVVEVDLVLFRGTKEELVRLCKDSNGEDGGEDGPDDGLVTITVNVRDDPKSPESAVTTILRVPTGSNVRQVLVDNGINVYQSLTRWTNCEGKQLCGTCIVNVAEGGGNTNRKSMDEESTLRENPDGYRLSCVTFAYGDVTVETFPPVEKSQWTR